MLNLIKTPHYIALIASTISVILLVINNRIGKKETNKTEALKLFVLVFGIVYLCQRFVSATPPPQSGGSSSMVIDDLNMDIDINDPLF